METELLEIVSLELKYCERCGGLWLRTNGSEEVYCEVCAIEMARVASAPKRRSHPRLPVAQANEAHANGHEWSFLCVGGGNS